MGFAHGGAGVDVELSGGASLRAEHLVGCDGRRSLIRKAAGIDFPGLDPSKSWIIGEVAAPPAVVIRPDGRVAWAAALTDPELPRVLATWFGPPAPT